MAVKEDTKPDTDKKKDNKGKDGKDGKKKDEEPELSDEDLELKKNLELMIERVCDADPGTLLTRRGHACMGERGTCSSVPSARDSPSTATL